MQRFLGRSLGRAATPAWAITFADLMTLLLAFFVLLYSFSNLETERFRAITGSIRAAFGADRTAIPDLPPAAPGGVDAASSAAQHDRRLAERLEAAVAQAGLTSRAASRLTSRGVAVRLDGEAAFAVGSAELRPEVTPLLDTIAEIASNSAGLLEVQGHTDDVPIASEVYPSNWELSAARAASVVRYVAGRGVAVARLRAVGYADTRPAAAGTTPGARALNRRVEFVFVRGEQDPAVESGESEAEATRGISATSIDKVRRIFSDVLDRPSGPAMETRP